MNNLPKVVAQQRRGRASNPRLLDRKSDALPLSHRATPMDGEGIPSPLTSPPRRLGCVSVSAESAPLARRLSPPPTTYFPFRRAVRVILVHVYTFHLANAIGSYGVGRLHAGNIFYYC